jgi:hypothetical protein
MYELVYSVYTFESYLYDALWDLDTDPEDALTDLIREQSVDQWTERLTKRAVIMRPIWEKSIADKEEQNIDT